MTAPDVRTAAQAEADKLYPLLTELEIPAISKNRRLRQKSFIKGAVWGAALVTPTREQIAEACERYLAERFADSNHPDLQFVIEDSFGCADAVLELIAELETGTN